MLMSISKLCAARLFSDIADEQQYILCIYGIELWLYTIISTIGLFLTGFLFRATWEAAVIIAVFYACQSNAGGFHADTHMKCFITMSIGLAAGLLMIRLFSKGCLVPSAGLIGIVLLLVFPLCLHENKQYLKINEYIFKRRSVICTLLIAAVTALLYLLNHNLFLAGCAGLFLSAISRTAAALLANQRRNI